MQHNGTNVLLQLLPITTMWLIFAVTGYFIAKRKGVNTMRFAIGIFPLWAGYFLLWWASLTDKKVLDRLAQLEKGS